MFDVFRVHVRTGAQTLVAQNPGNTVGWQTDHAGRVRIGVASDGVNNTVLYRESDGEPLRTLFSTDFRTSVAPQFFDAGNRLLYAISNRGRDKSALVLIDPARPDDERLVYQHPQVDLDGAPDLRRDHAPGIPAARGEAAGDDAEPAERDAGRGQVHRRRGQRSHAGEPAVRDQSPRWSVGARPLGLQPGGAVPREPGLLRAADELSRLDRPVNYVGVSNLFTFMKTTPPYWEPFRQQMYAMVGNPDDPADQARMTATSPALNAQRIRTPLLVAQGARDPCVNKAESDQIVEALRRRGVDVQYIVKDNEGHGFANEENRFEFYAAMEAFLARHLRPRGRHAAWRARGVVPAARHGVHFSRPSAFSAASTAGRAATRAA